MTREDYALIAHAMLQAKPVFCAETAAERSQHRHDCHVLAGVLKRANAAFDSSRFLAACGVAS